MATAKKKPTPAKRFIAIDSGENEIIEMGTLSDVKHAIEEYANDKDMTESEVDNYVQVFELGKEMMLNVVAKGVEVDIY